jgi:hypothetical protein
MTRESGWIKGTQKTNVFQENMMCISGYSISKDNSSLNIESKFGFVNKLGEVLIDTRTGN